METGNTGKLEAPLRLAEAPCWRVLVLDNIRSVINVGAIFRTADAIGIGQIFLTGYTPAPIDRFGRVRRDFAKAALGAETNLAWQSVASAEEAVRTLRAENFQIIALEQADGSVDYKKVETSDKVAVIVGNEVDGLPEEILSRADIVAEIPMLGTKESLNVATATAVFLFRVFDK